MSEIADRDRDVAEQVVTVAGAYRRDIAVEKIAELFATAREVGRDSGLVTAANIAESCGWIVGDSRAKAIGKQIRNLVGDARL